MDHSNEPVHGSDSAGQLFESDDYHFIKLKYIVTLWPDFENTSKNYSLKNQWTINNKNNYLNFLHIFVLCLF